MKYLSNEISTRKNLQYIAPKLGVDIPYLGKYLTNIEPYFVKVIELTGTPNEGNERRLEVGNDDYTDYNGLGLYLVGDDDTSYGEIVNISYSSETFEGSITVSENLPSGNNTYYIAKYYENIISQAPVIDISSKRYGELANIGTVNFSVNNAKEATYESDGYGVSAGGEVLTYATGDGETLNTDNIGKICTCRMTGGAADFFGERIITDVDETAETITVSPALPSSSIGYAHEVTVITNNYFTDIFSTKEYPEEEDCFIYIYLCETPSDDYLSIEQGEEIWTGKIQEVNNISNDTISFVAYNSEAWAEKGNIGNLITEDDGVLINGATIESLGEMKPICFGVPETFEQINTDYELKQLNNNLIKLKYLGYNAELGYKEYLVANHDVPYTNVLTVLTDPVVYYKNNAGRLCEISQGDVYVSETADGVYIGIANDIEITDYWYGNTAYDNLSTTSAASASYANLA